MNRNHSAECYRIIPIPNKTYFESRVICVCGLAKTLNQDAKNRYKDSQSKTAKQSDSPQIA